jgi:hypothetical protein
MNGKADLNTLIVEGEGMDNEPAQVFVVPDKKID